MLGGQTTEQGDCSRFKGNAPHCCKKDPTVVDLLPGTPYNQQIANCCKGGVLSSWAQDTANAVSSFQVSVGAAGTTNKTVRVPKNFTLKAPGPGYTCGPAKIVRPTKFITGDKRRTTQALSKFQMPSPIANLVNFSLNLEVYKSMLVFGSHVTWLFIFREIIMSKRCDMDIDVSIWTLQFSVNSRQS